MVSEQWFYHFKITCNPENPKRFEIEPIPFFSRVLNETETKYWPIELEMAGLVRLIRKIRYTIETAKQTTIIFTDHTANISITKQTILTNNNIDKFNFRLVKTSICFFQFRKMFRNCK